MSGQSYKAALRLIEGDKELAPYVGAFVNAKLMAEVVGGVTMVSGTITAATKDKKPVVLPFLLGLVVDLPESFDPSKAGTLLQGADGASTFQTKAGVVTAAWKTLTDGLIKVAFTVDASGFSEVFFDSALVEGFVQGVALAPGGGVVVPGPGGTRPMRWNEPLVIYGNVWNWDLDPDGLVRIAHAANCDGVAIEWGLFERDTSVSMEECAKRYHVAFGKLMAEAKRLNMVVFDSELNWNGKRTQGVKLDWYIEHIDKPKRQYEQQAGYIRQAIAEWDSTKHNGAATKANNRKISAWLGSHWAGNLSFNGSAREDKPRDGAKFLDWHVPNTNTFPTKPSWMIFISWDHSTVLHELGMHRGETPKLPQIAAASKRAIEHKCTIMGYHAGASLPDAGAAKAMAEFRGGQVPGPGVPPPTGGDDIAFTKSRMHYKSRDQRSLESLPVTMNLDSASIYSDGKMIRIKTDFKWQGSGGTNGHIGAAWETSDGVLTGGMFDHLRPKQSAKELKHLRGGSITGSNPIKGKPLYIYLLDEPEKARSPLRNAGIWPG